MTMRDDGIHRLIAAGIQGARKRRGWTQEDLATALRDAGLTSWRTSTVGRVEAGMRFPALDELLTICALLGVGLADLIPADGGEASLTPGVHVTASQVRAMITGDAGPVPLADNRPGALPSEAERRAARRLGVSHERVREAARALWGRGFDAERDSRVTAGEAGADIRRARRGHAARAMTGELRRALSHVDSATGMMRREQPR